MYKFAAIALLITGIIVLFFIDNIIDKATSNTILRNIYDNKVMVGSILIASSYYSYILSEKELIHQYIPEHIPEIIDVKLPSYSESVGTSDALNMSN